MKAHRYKGHVIRHAGGQAYRIFYKGDYVAYGTSLQGAKHWVDSYGKKRNPGGRKLTKKRKMTKLQRMNASARASKKRGLATLADKLFRKANPAMKSVMVSVRRLKGGGLSVIPRKVKR